MKGLFVLTFLLAGCFYVHGFNEEEVFDIICSVPEVYFRRYVGCVVSNSPEPFKKVSEILHNCVDTYWEIEDDIDAIYSFVCHEDVRNDEDIHHCLNNAPEPPLPTKEDLDKFQEAASICVVKA